MPLCITAAITKVLVDQYPEEKERGITINISQVEMEISELLAEQDYDEEAPIVHISALKALQGEEKWVQSIVDLMDACDNSIPDPERATDQPFLMPIEDIFTITGRGTVVTGVVNLPEGTEMVMPGNNVEMSVELIQPVAMDEGLNSRGQRGYCL